MPDADDFDIDSLRLLLGGGEKKTPEPAPGASRAKAGGAKKPAKSARAGSRGKGASPVRRKQP